MFFTIAARAVASATAIGHSIVDLIFPQAPPPPSREQEGSATDGKPESASTSASFDVVIFRKPANQNEEEIYRILGSHPRILKYLGKDPLTGQIMLPSLRNGDLLSHLSAHPGILVATRLTWAIEIAQGVAHLHARDVIWADPHLQNVLLTDDYHAILCDFGRSIYKASHYYNFTKGPPPIYICPLGYGSRTPRRTDIFGLGVILFVLLSERFPFHKDMSPSLQEQIIIMQKHDEIFRTLGVFDKLPPLLSSYFGDIINKCLTIEYQSADTLVTELEAAFSLWWQDNAEHWQHPLSPNSARVDAPYPQQPVHLPIEIVQYQYIAERVSPRVRTKRSNLRVMRERDTWEEDASGACGSAR